MRSTILGTSKLQFILYSLYSEVLIYRSCRGFGLVFKYLRLCNSWLIFLILFLRKPLVPSKEPSPLLNKKIEELEAKFADIEDLDEDLEEMEDEDDEAPATPSMPQHQTSMSSDLDLPNMPLQVIKMNTHTKNHINNCQGMAFDFQLTDFIFVSTPYRGMCLS